MTASSVIGMPTFAFKKNAIFLSLQHRMTNREKKENVSSCRQLKIFLRRETSIMSSISLHVDVTPMIGKVTEGRHWSLIKKNYTFSEMVLITSEMGLCTSHSHLIVLRKGDAQ